MIFSVFAIIRITFLQTTQAFIGDMIERHSGYIVGIASLISFYPVSTTILYTTSKFAVKGFMDALAHESQHENWGVKTLTVFPGAIHTRKEIVDYVLKKVGYVKHDSLEQ